MSEYNIDIESALSDNIKSMSDDIADIKKHQVELIYMLLNIDGSAIRFIKNPSEEMMLQAVKQNGMAIKYIPPEKQTEEIKMNAIESNSLCFEFVHEPTIQMWVKGILTELPEDEELMKKHPVKILKRIEMPLYQKKLLYETFLDKYPCDVRLISHDICEMDELDAAEVFMLLFKRHGDAIYADECPRNIIGKIIDGVMEDDPYFLRECPTEYWTIPRMKKILKHTVACIDPIFEIVKTKNMDTQTFVRYAFDVCKCESDIRFVASYFKNEINTCDMNILTAILESKNSIKYIETILHYWNIDRNGIEYILNRFPIGAIFDNVKYITFKNNIIPKLPLFKRIRYEHMMDTYIKENDTDGNN